MKSVAVLFARGDSNYKKIAGCDVFDKDRDAMTYQGGKPVIAHPPCRGWGRLRGLANPEPGELRLAVFALDQVRDFGGVLEHPKDSLLWNFCEPPGRIDKFGGWLFPINQFDFGHRATKKTFLYIVGCKPKKIPEFPLLLGEATHVCGAGGRRRDGSRLKKGNPGWRPEITKAEREHTPPMLCDWLVELARRCS